MLDGSDNAGSGRNACLLDRPIIKSEMRSFKSNENIHKKGGVYISTAYLRTLGILLVHDCCWESPLVLILMPKLHL